MLGAALVLLLAAVAAFVLRDDASTATGSASALTRADPRVVPPLVAARDMESDARRTRDDATSRAPRSLADVALIGAPEALPAAPAAAQTLEQAKGKLIAKAEGKIAKTESKIAKAEGSLASKQDQLAQRELDLADAQDTLDLVEGFLALAEQDLLDALALPDGTVEEVEIKAEAVAHAQLGVKLAQKEVKSYGKLVTSIGKAIDKLEAQIVTLEDKIATSEDVLAEQQDDLALLESPFDFRVEEDVPLGIAVRDASDQPISGARVLVTDELSAKAAKKPELLGSGAVYWQGLTDVDGRCDATLRLLPGQDAFDVIVDADGYIGPYSVEAHAERAGPFAPSARVSVTRDELADTTVALEEAP
ncbi:MAG: hypothetical protein H6825_15395 [Planctomycetes bacterium]|nr:hypothetical protein [Planctomycetota bacterium]